LNGILVRIGVDQAYGHWNAPVDEITGDFVYVPIPDGSAKGYGPDLRVSYDEICSGLRSFAEERGLATNQEFGFPELLRSCGAHLDPDFHWLTYGDNGAVRGKGIGQLTSGDLLVFYSGMRSIQRRALVYAITGLYVIDEIKRASEIPPARYDENAHTRWDAISPNDIVVRGRPDVSGRLQRCIVIGEFRDRAYRVTRELEAQWGGLSVKDGFIQRSIAPPRFRNASLFYDWFLKQGVQVVRRNN
jgi:hypothetical protein